MKDQIITRDRYNSVRAVQYLFHTFVAYVFLRLHFSARVFAFAFYNARSLYDVSTADVTVISLDPSWLSRSWEDSSEGRRRSNWGSTTSLTLTVLFHHLYHGDTWSWRRRDKCERPEREPRSRLRSFSCRFKLSGQFQLSGAKGSPLDKSGSSDAPRVPSDVTKGEKERQTEREEAKESEGFSIENADS